MKYAEDCDGFTLLECLIALAIASMALAVLYEASGTGLFATRRAMQTELALSVARSCLADMRARPVLSDGTREGDAANGFHWEETDTLVERGLHPDSPAGALFRVSVTVSWEGRRHLTLSTLRTSAMTGAGL